MTDKVSDLLQDSIRMMERYAICIKNDTNCNAQEEWNSLSPVLRHILDANERHKKSEEIFNEFMKELESISDAPDENELLGKYNKYLQNELGKLNSNDKFEEVKSLMLTLDKRTNDDSYIETVSQTISTIDPITKLPMTDPVKNTKCGHVYEKSSIYHLLKSKKTVKCPIGGCAVDSIKKTDLVPDVALKRHLDNMKK